ncbi:ABC transporter ATP-binding protein [Blastochloris viridis]|uniref:Fe(3+) ions import ATP-binding protein FbpC 2 n=1 Tax=Blastochloris viridis TaxID=1079 RepID=A0A0H5BHH0_BLAVI|nr:ABC transporter ATP-binding protein [Blastochloris viridis]ALK10212.1 Fe(3+) ions import ATP-binding protein FbpC 2 [Blastochloris viridis]BAR99856.1 ferric iron ABC transporter [Blastochloris viridis]CUU42876.1 Fe(3+) ions import ATP-binding protein FbpC 2 [Blastochloris viridis]
MSAGFALSLEHVRHSYGDKVAVADVSLAVRAGEIVALLGPSGCGKSTLLRLAAGLERPDAGKVAVGGRIVAGEGAFVPPERRGLSLVFQDYALFPHLDIAANVAFGLKGRPRGEIGAIVADLLGRIGLADRARAYPHMLSGGEQQRVALARALAPNPAVLLMDEPFSNLDQRLREGMRTETVRLLRERGAAAVLVTHDPDDALAAADRMALMRAGRLVQVGTPEEVFRAPADRFAARLFGEVAEVPAVIAGGRAWSALGAFPTPRLADGPGIVCVRRDAVTLADGPEAIGARVLATRFLGERRQLRLQVDGLETPIEVAIDRRLNAEPGGRVSITVDRADAFVFPA